MAEHGDMNFQVTALTDLRAQFVQALEADSVAPPQPYVHRSRLQWRRAWAVPAIALAVALVVIAISAIPWSSNPTVAEATADVAKTALGAEYPPDDWFTYSRSRSLGQLLSATPDHTPSYSRVEREAWLSVSRSGIVKTIDLSNPELPPQVYRYPALHKYRIGSESYTRREIDAFAKNPQVLLRIIDAQAAGERPEDQAFTKWTIITEALRDLAPPLPPTVRAALIGDLATVRGVTVADPDHDPLGRPAVGLVFAEQDTRSTVWFEKSTSALSYSINVVAKIDGHRGPDVHVGDILERFELLESKATPTAPTR